VNSELNTPATPPMAIPADRVGFMVVGSARSGTTLLQRLACEITGVRMPPETHFFSDFAWAMSHRRKFPLGMPGLREEVEGFAGMDNSKGLNIDVDGLVEGMGGECPGIFALFDAIVRQLTGLAEIYGEKTPGHLWWWRSIARAAPWMRFVVAVRDPRAVVASTLSMPWSVADDLAPWGDRIHLAYAGRWEFDQQLVAALSDELGAERSLIVRYEDLVLDSDAVRLKIAGLLGRHADVSYQSAPSDLVHPWEPWKQHAMDDVTPDRIDTWRADLGRKRSDEVATICSRGMDRFGYGDSRPGPVRSKMLTAGMGKKARQDLETMYEDVNRYEGNLAKIDL
jgi:hypothetical protein